MQERGGSRLAACRTVAFCDDVLPTGRRFGDSECVRERERKRLAPRLSRAVCCTLVSFWRWLLSLRTVCTYCCCSWVVGQSVNVDDDDDDVDDDR